MSRFICVCALFTLSAIEVQAQDRIQQIRDDANASVTAPQVDTSNNHVRKATQDDPNCQSDDNAAGGVLLLFGAIVASPYVIPHWLLHDDFTDRAQFLPYPYSHNYPGYLFRSNCWPDEQEDGVDFGHPPHIQPWSLRFSAEDGSEFNGMNRVGLRFAFDTAWRIGFQTNWNYLSDHVGARLRDQTWLGDSALTVRFAQNEWINFYSGLGARLLTDPHATDWGFNFIYGFDAFPKKPWILSALFDTGNVGSAWIIHGRGTIGASFKHFEVFSGYDFMRVGSVSVQGPLIGLRLWF